MSLLNSRGFSITTRIFPVITKSHVVQWEFVRQGLVISGMLEQIGDQEHSVERIVIANLEPIVADVWIVTHQELRSNRRVRLVFDFIVSEFSNY